MHFKKTIKPRSVNAVLLCICFVLLIVSCDNSKKSHDGKMQILQDYKIELINDEPYVFQASDKSGKLFYQIIKRWDIIFTGETQHSNDSSMSLHKLIPGDYMHTLLYLGKDSDGNGYVVELNQYNNGKEPMEKISVNVLNGLKIEAGIMLHSIGKDDNLIDSKDKHDISFKDKEIYIAKRINKIYLEKINKNKNDIFARIKNDLINKYPYQIPINFSILDIYSQYIVDDGFENGSSCAEYIYLLFEEYANVCIDDIFASIEEFLYYYKNDPDGQKAFVPADKNFLDHKDIYFSEAIEKGFVFKYKKPYKGFCNPSQKNRGIAIPDKLYKSQYLVDI